MFFILFSRFVVEERRSNTLSKKERNIKQQFLCQKNDCKCRKTTFFLVLVDELRGKKQIWAVDKEINSALFLTNAGIKIACFYKKKQKKTIYIICLFYIRKGKPT